MIEIGVREVGVHRAGAGGHVAQTGANDGDPDGGNGDAEEGEEEDLPAGRLGGIIAVVVGCDGAPAGGRREIDGEEAEERGRQAYAHVQGGNGRVDVLRHLADEDH